MNWKKIKKKEKAEKTPKVKKVSRKKATTAVSISFVALLIFSGVAVIRSNVMATNMSETVKKVEKLEKQEKPQETKEIDVVSLSHYVTGFVKEYITYDSDEKDTDKRFKRLSTYVSFDAGQLDEGIKGKYKRTLKSAELSEVETSSESLLAHVTVSYEEKLEKKTIQKSEVLVLPIVEKDGLYAIVSRPYILALEMPKGKTTPLETVKKPLDVDAKERKKMETFLTLFFGKYAQGNKEELALLMKEPVLTTGSMKFKELEKGSLNFFVTKEKELQGVQVSAVFEDKESKVTHVENFTLWIGETENSQFIYTFKQYFTESREK
ncbi:conjugal transfer protein [Enterococcus rotai]|uniref:conjugal transfer protein n=1 Tax=Enterococcus rotai TaxID=118060 RepID=UPI0032B35FFD